MNRRMRPERIKELTLLLLIVGSLVVFSLVIDNYLSGRFFNRVTQGIAVTAVMAAGQSLVIITRNIDLSVGSIAGVSAYLTGDVLGDHLGTPSVLAVLAGDRDAARAWSTARSSPTGGSRRSSSPWARWRSTGPWLISYAEAQRSRPTRCPSGPSIFPGRPCSPSASTSSARCSCWRSRDHRPPGLLSRFRAGRIRLRHRAPTPRLRCSRACRHGRTTIAASPHAERSPVSVASSCWPASARSPCPPGRARTESIAAAVVGGVSTLGGSGTIVGSFFGAVLIGLLDQSIVRAAADQRVRSRCRARAAHPPRRRARRLAVARFVHRRTIMPADGTGAAPRPMVGVAGDRETVATGVRRVGRGRRPRAAQSRGSRCSS